MRGKKMLLLLFLLAALPMFAQTPGGSGVSAGELKFLGAAIGMGIASGLCGVGRGSHGSQSRSQGTDPDRHGSRPGADRVAGHLHAGNRVERN
jgi:hypothetical protein